MLTRMARLIASGTRGRDLVGRYGGEEFVLLLDDPEGTAPLTAAQRLVDRAEAACLIDRAEGREHGPEAHCRLSVGVARRHPGEPLDALVGRADAALYAAKAAGRARAMLAD
jgi:diguanylate cyclase (GGDEF)-like protein